MGPSDREPQRETRPKSLRPLAVWVFSLVVLCSTAYADGAYFAPINAARIPDIPRQRAIVTWRDGVENLLVESSLVSGEREFGWVLPVPSAPDKLETASGTLLNTLFLAIQPNFLAGGNHLRALEQLVFVLDVAVLEWMFNLVLLRKRRWRCFPFISFFFFFVCLLLVAPYASRPKDYAYRGDGPDTFLAPGIAVENSQVAGIYQVDTLRAESTTALDGWLRNNGFMALPPEAAPIVDDYIRQGWRFVTARVREAARPGLNAGLTPTPLKLTFRSSNPVYPMRLTRLAGSSVYLDLCVLADRPVETDALRVDAVARCQRQRLTAGPPSEGNAWNDLADDGFVYELRGLHRKFGYPEITELMWDNCVLTRMSGVIAPGGMDSDLSFRFTPHVMPFRLDLYSSLATRQYGLLCSFLCWAAAGALLTPILAWRKMGIGRYPAVLAAIVVLGVLAHFCGLLYRDSLPAGESVSRNLNEMQRAEEAVRRTVQNSVARGEPCSREGIQAAILERMAANDSPGAGSIASPDTWPELYILFEKDGRHILRLFESAPRAGSFGQPRDYVLPACKDTSQTEDRNRPAAQTP